MFFLAFTPKELEKEGQVKSDESPILGAILGETPRIGWKPKISALILRVFFKNEVAPAPQKGRDPEILVWVLFFF